MTKVQEGLFAAVGRRFFRVKGRMGGAFVRRHVPRSRRAFRVAVVAPFVLLLFALAPARGQPAASGLVAAYAFQEGTGTATGDASGNGNGGSIGSATWTSQGKFGNALTFNGTDARVTIPDAPSLRLTNAMTLEAWVYPTTVTSAWRDVVYKGDDNYYLSGTSAPSGRPAVGGIFAGSYGEAYATANLPLNTWTHLAGTYDGGTLRLYVNGAEVASSAKSGALSTSSNPLQIGGDALYGQYFTGRIDEVRVYNTALSAAQVQTDMNTAIGGGDTQPPTVSITAPANNAQVGGSVTVTADASDDTGVAGVQLVVDGTDYGPEDTTAPYSFTWDTRSTANGSHTLTARARDAAGNVSASTPVTVNVANTGTFQNEILATGFNLPTSIAFLPDGRMLVAEEPGTIRILSPPYLQADPTPFLQLANVAQVTGANDGLTNLTVDPNFATNHYFYVTYTLGNPVRTRISRFTANAAGTGTVAGSELVLYQDPGAAGIDHHGGAVTFGNDGKIYFTTGDEVSTPGDAQLLTSPRGKIHRINPDGTVPTDNPFYDGNGPNVDSIWALGLRNPFRAFYDAPTGRLYVGDVGGNNYATAVEEIDLGARGANYAWPNCESSCASPPYTNPLYSYPHNGRDAAVVSGFVYHGNQFPSAYQGSFFFADYTQNWIKRLTFDANGNVNGLFNFEPPDGSLDGPYGDIVSLTEGTDGALYYVDIGYDDNTGQLTQSKIRRIRFVTAGNQPPTAASSADTTSGPAPLAVNFSSAGSSDPEGQPLSYSWDFGDGTTSTAANPAHTYTQAGRYTVRLTVSDGVNTDIAAPLTITVGSPPTATILAPQDGLTFRGGDVISFSGSGTDAQDGTLPASAFTWNIDFLHENHVHPGTPLTGVKSGTFTIPTTGHDFSGNTRYRISLTVTDSDGLTNTQSVIIWPQKVNLTFDTAPSGLTLYLDGIAMTTPFVHDTLIGFNHTIEARNQTSGGTAYTFQSWSDGGAQSHTVVVPAADASYLATFQSGTTGPPAPVAAYSFDEGSGTAVADSSGHGNGGTIGNATWTSAGKFGSALSFNGSNARVTVANAPSLQLSSSLTLEAWVKPSTVSAAWRDVIYKGDDNYYLSATSAQSPGVPAGGGIFNGAYGEAYGSSALAANAWSHLALTYDGATLRLYVNGTQVGSTAETGAVRTSTSPLELGGDSLYGQYFSGAIDEVRLYATTLTQAQIQSDMTTAIGGGTGSDTQPPTAPSNLAATAGSSTQIDLSWTAATDDVGVTGYRVERCQGSGCSNFSQVGTSGSTTFGDTGLAAGTTYRYRVRAVDLVGNLGPYSNVATATTQQGSGSTLVAAYGFSEGTGTSTADSSGAGNAGTLVNATWTTAGKFGTAVSFNGTNARVSIADSAKLHLTSGMTLEAWVYPTAVSRAWRDVIYKGKDNYYLSATSSKASTAPAGGATIGKVVDVYGTKALPVNTWTHLAVTYDGAALRLFVNGTQVSSIAKTGTIRTSTQALELGGDSIYGQFFSGRIDEVRVFNAARTAAQVQSDMNTPVG